MCRRKIEKGKRATKRPIVCLVWEETLGPCCWSARVTLLLLLFWASSRLLLMGCCAVLCWAVSIFIRLNFRSWADTKSSGQLARSNIARCAHTTCNGRLSRRIRIRIKIRQTTTWQTHTTPSQTRHTPSTRDLTALPSGLPCKCWRLGHFREACSQTIRAK